MPGSDTIVVLTYRNWVSALVLIAILFSMGKVPLLKALSGVQLAGFAASALLGGTLGLFLFFNTLKIAPASKVVPLTASFPMVTYILSVWLLGEPFTLKGLLGVGFIILGAILLS